MCGVLGLIQKNTTSVGVEEFKKSVALIDPRGPDASGVVSLSDDRVLLGHTRLAILDLSEAGAQPMSFSGSHLSYNGEIYNHSELRQKLDHPFKGHSDTETLLAGLRQNGVKFLEDCRGMFAGAFFDESLNKLFLFRDTIGIKPMYYVNTPSRFVFGSEIKAILPLSGRSPEINRDVVNCYLHKPFLKSLAA